MSQVDDGGWCALLNEIQRTEHLLPKDEIWAVAATQTLAEFILDLGDTLPEERRTSLIQIAAMVSRQGNREIMAALQADLALRRAALA